MDYLKEHIANILMEKKIYWFGGGYYLAKPTIEPHLLGGVFFSKNDQHNLSQSKITINLEDLFDSRPDWNRLNENQVYNSMCYEVILKNKESFNNCLLFPYYVSSFAEKIGHLIGASIVGNSSAMGEKIYIRKEGREIAKGTGFILPETYIFKLSELPAYSDLCQRCQSNALVLTPPFSDGGAWVYIARNESDFLLYSLEINDFFIDDYIEITPYYDGISLNVNVCNMPINNGNDCSVIVYPPSIQIIGEPTLSDNKMRYCGCDFASVASLFDMFDFKPLFDSAVTIGQKLFKNYDWKGFFGIDVILRPDGSFLFLEINPRLQSSTHVLDILFRNEWNPMLRQLESFLVCNNIKRISSYDVFNQRVNASMIIAYNNKQKPLCMNKNTFGLDGAYGLSKISTFVDPGAVLFRCNFNGPVVDISKKMLNTLLKMKVEKLIAETYSNASCNDNRNVLLNAIN